MWPRAPADAYVHVSATCSELGGDNITYLPLPPVVAFLHIKPSVHESQSAKQTRSCSVQRRLTYSSVGAVTGDVMLPTVRARALQTAFGGAA